jgi:hypothetical protein
VQEVAFDLQEKMSKSETAHVINLQVKPLIQAIASYEQSLTVLEHSLQQQYEEIRMKSHHVESQYEVFQQQSQSLSNQCLTVDKLPHILSDYLRQHQLGDITREKLSQAILQCKEDLLQEMNIWQSSQRLETLAVQREDLRTVQQELQQQLALQHQQCQEIR